jgi:hypothetical protein
MYRSLLIGHSLVKSGLGFAVLDTRQTKGPRRQLGTTRPLKSPHPGNGIRESGAGLSGIRRSPSSSFQRAFTVGPLVFDGASFSKWHALSDYPAARIHLCRVSHISSVKLSDADEPDRSVTIDCTTVRGPDSHYLPSQGRGTIAHEGPRRRLFR